MEGIGNIQGEIRSKGQSQISLFLQKIGIAALVTVVFYLIAVLINHGSLFYDEQGNFILGQIIWQEVFLQFLFLLTLFWSHIKISEFIHSPIFGVKKPMLKSLVEIVMVVIISLILINVIYFLPFLLLFPEIEPDPEQMRIGYVLSVFVSLFFYFFVEREKSRKIYQAELLRSARLQKENFQAQLQHLKNQVNPHFLFNSLNVLGSLITKDRDKAVLFVRRLADVYRSFLENSGKQLISLHKEMELTKAYIYLLTTRFGDNIHFQINVDDKCLKEQLPPGSLQMLIENAVKHNGSTSRQPLIVSVFNEDNKLVVQNNLKARKDVRSTRNGLNNIKSRYKFLSDKEIEIEKTTEKFIVKLPLLKIRTHEYSDH